MPQRITALEESQIVADLLRAQRRNGRALGALQLPSSVKDELTIATNGQPPTWQLSFLPLAESINLTVNGVSQIEGTDYTVAYTTGLVSFSSTLQASLLATPAPADHVEAKYQTNGDLVAAGTTTDFGGPYGDPTDLQILSNAAKLGASPPGGAGRYWGWVETGRQYNDVTATIVDPANETAYVACLIASPNTGSPGYIAATGGGGTVGYAWFDPITAVGASGSLGGGSHTAYTLRAALSSSGVLTVYQNGTSIGTVDIATANPTAWANLQGATKVGFGVQTANTNVTLDSWQTTDGLWSDSFNRANQQGLGSLDTGQVWSYDP